jgi:hypothetical protein
MLRQDLSFAELALSRGFRRGVAEKAVVHASDRVTLVFIFHPRFTNTVAGK